MKVLESELVNEFALLRQQASQCCASRFSMPYTYSCPQCGDAFSTDKKNKKYCTKACYTAAGKTDRSYALPDPPTGAKCIAVGHGKAAIVDEDMFESVARHLWIVKENDYAISRIGDRNVRLHHFVIGGRPQGLDVDHINGNRLDNRRANLRPATRAQNLANMQKSAGGSSRFKGVRFCKERGVWHASISINNRPKFLGSFYIEEDAARAYDAAARRIRGEFACVNFPQDGERAAVS